jgi:hypothetical protein
MNLGDVFYWTTEKVKGHDSRAKYHIYVCPSDSWDDHTFLLINKAPWGDELKITKDDYQFLQYDRYIGCNGIVTYTDIELAAFDPKPVGQITKEHLQALFNILADPLVMERMQAKRLCNALKSVF